MRATPGVYAIERSSRVFSGAFGTTSSLPPRWSRNVRSETCSTSIPSSARTASTMRSMCLVGREHGHVAHLLPLLDADEVDRAEQPARIADRVGQPRKGARLVLEVDAQRRAERCRRMDA